MGARRLLGRAENWYNKFGCFGIHACVLSNSRFGQQLSQGAGPNFVQSNYLRHPPFDWGSARSLRISAPRVRRRRRRLRESAKSDIRELLRLGLAGKYNPTMKTTLRPAETEADIWTGIMYPDGNIPT